MNNNSGNRILFANSLALNDFPRTAKNKAEWYEAVVSDGLAILSVYGGLGEAVWDYAWMSYSDITSKIEQFMTDDKIKSVALVINSPGGMASGLLDCCNYIKEAAKKKPICAFIEGMACSAAFAIATACNKVFIKDEAVTGCCGCYAEALEVSEEGYKEAGFLHKIFRSSNAPKKNLSIISDKEASEKFQAEIDALGESYLNLVATNRGVDPKEAKTTFGEGAVVSADYAIANKMVDEISTLENFFEYLTGSLNSNGEGEGDNMEDIKSMSAEEIVNALSDEQKKSITDALCASNPSLTEDEKAEVRKAERERLTALNAMRDGSDSVNAIVDEAVENGKCSSEIELSVVKAQLDNTKKQLAEKDTQPTNLKVEETDEAIKAKAVEMILGATELVNVPSSGEMSEQEAVDMLTKN